MGVKVLCLILTLIMGGGMRFDKITDSFNYPSQVVVRIDNVQTVINKGDDKYEKIIDSLNSITRHSHEMPAFGVSIDDETVEEKKKGIWLELIFDQPCKYNGMDFESLLIKVEKDWHGFNLIRKNNGKYDGRCFYLSLNNSMQELFDAINKTSLEGKGNDK